MALRLERRGTTARRVASPHRFPAPVDRRGNSWRIPIVVARDELEKHLSEAQPQEKAA
jgi:hypothetical protein